MKTSRRPVSEPSLERDRTMQTAARDGSSRVTVNVMSSCESLTRSNDVASLSISETANLSYATNATITPTTTTAADSAHTSQRFERAGFAAAVYRPGGSVLVISQLSYRSGSL